MKIARALPALPSSIADAIGTSGSADLYSWMRGIYDQMVDALNGGIEAGENTGVVISGTTTAVADDPNDVTHGLGRIPSLVLLGVEADPAVTTFPVTFYWKAADRTSNWTTAQVRFRCNRASVGYVGWVV